MIASPESIPTAIHLRKTLVNHRPKFPITRLVHFGEHPSLESAVSGVIDAWLRKCTDPTSSCLPHFRAILHILRLRVISHTVGKGLKGRSRRSCEGKRRSFSFTFSSIRTLPTTRTAPSSLSKSSLSSSFTSANKESA